MIYFLMHRYAFVCRRIARAAEDVAEDVVEEIDELRRSFSARLRSETLQRQSENLEKDSKIHKLETMLESQLQREKTKDRKIAELEVKVEAIAELRTQTETDVILHQQPTTLLTETDADVILTSETGKQRNDEMKNENTSQEDNTVEISTSQPLDCETEAKPNSASVNDEAQCSKKLKINYRPNTETQIDEHRLPVENISRGRKILCLPKRKRNQTTTT